MNTLGVSDLSRGFVMCNRNSGLNRALVRLGNEVVTGQSSDKTARLNGHFTYLTQIETDLTRHQASAVAVAEAATLASTTQSVLGRISDNIDQLTSTLAITAQGPGRIGFQAATAQARGALDEIVSTLNTSVAGRSLFAGTETDSAALASADTLLTNLKAAITGETSIADIEAAADAFFNQSGGGFENSVYLGSFDPNVFVSLGAGVTVQISTKANDPAIRDLLKSVALVALADDPSLTLADATRQQLVEAQLSPLLSSRDQIIRLRAETGFSEDRIERVAARIEAEQSALQLARNDLLAVDPYEAASELEATRNQLEALYAVTARTSQLSLVNFLS